MKNKLWLFIPGALLVIGVIYLLSKDNKKITNSGGSSYRTSYSEVPSGSTEYTLIIDPSGVPHKIPATKRFIEWRKVLGIGFITWVPITVPA